jgi:signal transduction histidine kinase
LLELTDNIPEIREDVTTMDRNTNRLIELVSQILDFRQIEMKVFTLDFTVVNICEVLQEMFLNFTLLARKRNLQYNLTLPPYEIKTFADEEALRKIFSNLLSNAIKFAAKEVQIRLFIAENKEEEFIIEIENDGYIIPAEMREKIFEPFYRLKETTKQKGTGIGLTLARSLSELHKGSLIVKDHKIKTNVFVLKLPLLSEHIKTKTDALVKDNS